jgi:hypothetical protein
MGKNKEDFEDKWQFIFRLLEGELSLLVPAYFRTKQLRGVSVNERSGTAHVCGSGDKAVHVRFSNSLLL